MPSDDWLPDIDDEDLSIDKLIEQITVDAYGDEGYWSFRQAFEDHVDLPIGASVVGSETTITEIGFDGDERRGLTANVTRDDRTWTVSLLDIEVSDVEVPDAAEVRFTRLTHAYRRWLGLDQ